jgi:hypothetical protein
VIVTRSGCAPCSDREAASWRVLAGPDASRLAPLDTAAWNGLDTAQKHSGAPQVVEVVALDARGRVLGSSEPTTTA